MVENGIESDLKFFIAEYFDSIEAIEVVLLLKNQSTRAWQPAELSAALRSSLPSIESRLAEQVRKGILVCDEQRGVRRYRYSPCQERIAEMMNQLGELFILRRFTIINLLYSSELNTIRDFAKAFDLRRGPNDR